jgi:lipopolysaccharide/colanic/teichoic acid biosynthesis glycosyltransferase
MGDELSRVLCMSAMNHGIMDVDKESRMRAKSIDTRYESIKPFLDFPLAALMLLVSAPIILISMLLVRMTSRGRAIYTQNRLGLGGSDDHDLQDPHDVQGLRAGHGAHMVSSG